MASDPGSRPAVPTTPRSVTTITLDGPAMLFELLNHCLGIDCHQIATATWGAVSAGAYYLSNAATKF